MRIALHGDCVACLARTDPDNIASKDPLAAAEEATIVVLVVLRSGIDQVQVHRDLCFAHRRRVESAAERCTQEEHNV